MGAARQLEGHHVDRVGGQVVGVFGAIQELGHQDLALLQRLLLRASFLLLLLLDSPAGVGSGGLVHGVHGKTTG